MDSRLINVMESLLLSSMMINQEVQRLERCEQFSSSIHCLQLIERICQNSLCTIYTARAIERALQRRKKEETEEKEAAISARQL